MGVVELEDHRIWGRCFNLRRIDHVQRAAIGVAGLGIKRANKGHPDVCRLDGVTIHGRDVVELGARTQLDGPGDRVGRFSAQGQVTLDVMVGDDLGIEAGLEAKEAAHHAADDGLSAGGGTLWVQGRVEADDDVEGASRARRLALSLVPCRRSGSLRVLRLGRMVCAAG